ncbi:MAG: alpha/beta hydrolase [Pseudomonadota bacterium]
MIQASFSYLSALLMLLAPPPPSEAESFKMEVAGDFFVASGTLVPSSKEHIRAMRQGNQNIKILVMQNVPGSDDDNDYLDAAWGLHQNGFTIIVPSDGLIASGGTDFFLAGTFRIIQPGACIGVHSWEDDGPPPYAANQLPRNHAEHGDFLEYFRAIGISPEFYWFTINAAPASGMHWMSPAEINRFKMSSIPLPADDRETPAERQARCDNRVTEN